MNVDAVKVTNQMLDDWATKHDGPVALHLKQKLLPVEIDGQVIFPPTYADIGYNIDKLSDGTSVATIDSVGSQANRLEPIFKNSSDDKSNWLVPQLDIVIGSKQCGKCEACQKGGKKAACNNAIEIRRSILDLAHRSADATVKASPGLAQLIEDGFEALQHGNAGPLCSLAPTSLVFGVWDSRGGSGEKRPRLLRSIIRAWNVESIHSAAQYNSIWKALPENAKKSLEDESKKQKTELSEKGFQDAPCVFRKTDKVSEYRDGSLNMEARTLGGVVVRGSIERDITVNLVALRGLRGKDDLETTAIRKYLLGLTLFAATADIDLFLREGCLLRYAGQDTWHQIPRRGEPKAVDLASARKTIETYASEAAKYFRETWGILNREYVFDVDKAKKLLAKKAEEKNLDGEK